MRRGGLAAVFAVWAAGCATAPPVVLVNEIDFKKELTPYGEWIVVAPYGRLWHPNPRLVGRDFVPYLTGGEWVLGDDGWTFESQWPWGKFPFHYGRWLYVDDLDWLWSPDREWGPAWVEWRVGGGHVAWSPLAPEVRAQRPRPPRWTLVKARHFAQRDVQRFTLSREEAARAEGRVEPMVPSPGKSGPSPDFIVAEGGLEKDSKQGYRAPTLPVPAPPPPEPEQQVAPVPAEEVEKAAPPAPAPKKEKKTRAKKKRAPSAH